MMATELALSKVLHVRRPPAPSSPRPDASSETPRAARSRHANLEGGKPQSMPRMQDLMAALPHEDGPASTSRARRGGAGRLFSPDTPGGTRKVRGSGAWGDPALGYMGTPSAGRRQASAARDSLSLAWDEAGERPSTAPAQSVHQSPMKASRNLSEQHYSSVGSLIAPDTDVSSWMAGGAIQSTSDVPGSGLHTHAAFAGAAGASSSQIANAETPDTVQGFGATQADASAGAAGVGGHWQRGNRNSLAAAYYSTVGDLISPPPPGSMGGEQLDSASNYNYSAYNAWGGGGSPPHERPQSTCGSVRTRTASPTRSLLVDDDSRYRGSAGVPRTGGTDNEGGLMRRGRTASPPRSNAQSLGCADYNMEEAPRYSRSIAHMAMAEMAHAGSTAGHVIFGGGDEAAASAVEGGEEGAASSGRFAQKSPWKTDRHAWRERAIERGGGSPRSRSVHFSDGTSPPNVGLAKSRSGFSNSAVGDEDEVGDAESLLNSVPSPGASYSKYHPAFNAKVAAFRPENVQVPQSAPSEAFSQLLYPFEGALGLANVAGELKPFLNKGREATKFGTPKSGAAAAAAIFNTTEDPAQADYSDPALVGAHGKEMTPRKHPDELNVVTRSPFQDRLPVEWEPLDGWHRAPQEINVASKSEPAGELIWSGLHAGLPETYAAKSMKGLNTPRTIFAEHKVHREAADRQKRVVASGGSKPDWR